MIQWHLETRKIKDLTPHGKNPRQLSKDQERQITMSLEKFGLADKPIVNVDGKIIGGHMRLKVLQKQKVQDVECWVPDHALSDNDVDELCVRLNKNTGDWDWDILANQWEITDLINWGFTEEELAGFADIEEIEPKEEKPKVPKLCPHCNMEI
jgi:ParB-like chromosome segregation protein Spo0J